MKFFKLRFTLMLVMTLRSMEEDVLKYSRILVGLVVF
jgi:hypothetical protein